MTGDWFNLAHPWPLRSVLEMLAWQPELMGANRENHIMRTAWWSDVRTAGAVRLPHLDAPAPAEDVLRLAFKPKRIMADGKPLPRAERLVRRTASRSNRCPTAIASLRSGTTAAETSWSKATIRKQDGRGRRLQYEGDWWVAARRTLQEETGRRLAGRGEATFEFDGNQVRLIGRAVRGGKADVYLDGVKQLCGIDFWCPQIREQQVLYYRQWPAARQARPENGRREAARTPVPRDARSTWSRAVVGRQGKAVSAKAAARRIRSGSSSATWAARTTLTPRDFAGGRPRSSSSALARAPTWCRRLLDGPRLKEVAGTADAEIVSLRGPRPRFHGLFHRCPGADLPCAVKFCQAEQPPRRRVRHQHRHPGQGWSPTWTSPPRPADRARPSPGVQRHPARNGIIAIRFRGRAGELAMIQGVEIEKVR